VRKYLLAILKSQSMSVQICYHYLILLIRWWVLSYGGKKSLPRAAWQPCRSVSGLLPIGVLLLHGLICLVHDMSGRFTDLLKGHPGIDMT
jgi:hypothetical protein